MSCTKIKICDVRTMEALQICQDNHADFIGVHKIDLPITAEDVVLFQKIVAMSGEIQTVLLTKKVPIDEVVALLKQVPFDYVQLHRPCSISEVIELKEKALQETRRNIGVIAVFTGRGCDFNAVREMSRYAEFILFDSSHEGGTGATISKEDLKRIAENCEDIRYFIAGGLDPDNVEEVIRIAKPYGVDVQSRLEIRKHVKDPAKVKAFVCNVRGC